MKALLISVNFTTGDRAGGIDPRDANLQSYGWQSPPNRPGPDVEIRVVEDDRDLSEYDDVDGVQVLRGVTEINDAIDKWVPPSYGIGDREDVREWARRNDVDLDEFPDATYERAKALFESGADTVTKSKPPKIHDVVDDDPDGEDEVESSLTLPDSAPEFE